MTGGSDGGSAAPRGGFPTTRWTIIQSVKADPAARRQALHELLATYWLPLYHFARRKGLSPDDAQDAVQGLCVRLLERDFLERLDRERGRLRDYLRRSLDHHIINEHARGQAARRGGGLSAIPLEDAERTLPAATEAPEVALDRAWARTVMERALDRLRAEFASGSRRGSFAAVAEFFSGDEPPPYGEVAARHGQSLPQLKSLLHRSRNRYRELIAEEIADTVSHPADVEPEMRALIGALAG